jgi:hypothetical protein
MKTEAKANISVSRCMTNYSFLANFQSREMFQRVNVPRLYEGLYHQDTVLLAAFRGREWGKKLRGSARADVQRLRGQFPQITESVYQMMWIDGLKAAEMSDMRTKCLRGLR